MAPIPTNVSTQYAQWLSEQKDRTPITVSINKQWFELSYNGRTLKYAVAVFGSQPATGYPLYIGLHGGGATTQTENDTAWWVVFDQWYGPLVKRQAEKQEADKKGGAIYISARGVSNRVGPNADDLKDTYDLHSQPESYYLLQQMIMNFFLRMPNEIKNSGKDYSAQLNKDAAQFVNSNLVYLLGFSAGGNGVYQLAPKISDRFASVVASAGHPEGATFVNLARLPICLQCGEEDIYNTETVKFNRAKVTVRANKALNKLQALAGEDDMYRHDCHIVKGKVHGDWANDVDFVDQEIINNLTAWDTNPEGEGSQDAAVQVINPVSWAAKFTRKPIPSPVIWDLSSRPPKPEGPPKDWEPQRLSYWLYIHDPDSYDLAEDDVISASYRKTEAANWITVNKATRYLGLLINEDMLDFKRDIAVWEMGTKIGTISVGSGGLSPSPRLQLETLQARGDTKLVFSKLVYFVPKIRGVGWDIKVANSLETNALFSGGQWKMSAKI